MAMLLEVKGLHAAYGEIKVLHGIDFVVVNVADADASLRFYREVVGIDAPLTEESPNWVEFDTAPVALALRRDAGGAGVNAAIALAVAPDRPFLDLRLGPEHDHRDRDD